MGSVMRWLTLLVCFVTLAASQKAEQCDRLDLVFIVDSSGSICDDDITVRIEDGNRICRNWEFVREFMADIINRVEIGPRFVRVAMVTFGNKGVTEWNLDTYMEKDKLLDAVLNLRYRSQNTNTSGGLTVAREEVFTTAGGDRSNAANVAIVITDGKSTYDHELTIPNAERLRDESKALVFSVGITRNIDEEELQKISSPPQIEEENYFRSATFADLGQILDTLVNQTCEQIDPTPSQCSNEIDLLFVLDGSDFVDISFGKYTEWDAVVRFVQDIVMKWGLIGVGGGNFGVIVYGDDATLEIPLGQHNDIDQLVLDIGELTMPGGSANMKSALQIARDQVFTDNNPQNRPDVLDLVILVAGGEPSADVDGEHNDLKNNGVGIYVIGSTTDISESTMKAISSGQQAINEEYWLLLTFDSLESIELSVSGQMVDLVCEGLPRGPEVPDVDVDCDMDIVILVDSSGSIKQANPPDNSYENWDVIKGFLRQFAESTIDLGNATRLAIVRFSTEAHVDIYLDDYLGDLAGLETAIEAIPYDGHWTNTPAALDLARTAVFTAARGDRPKAVNVAIVLTDGKPEVNPSGFLVDETIEAARKLKGHGTKGVKIFAIGVTTEATTNPISDETLKGMSSEPQLINENYWKRPDFRSLISLLQDLTQDACDPDPNPCAADIVFVLDYSSSIGYQKYRYVRDFVSSFVNDMDLADESRVGITLFSDDMRLGFHLNKYTDRKEAASAVLDMKYVGGRTGTAAALNFMTQEMFTSANGDRPDVRNVAIVITDGGSNRPDKVAVIEAAKSAKAAGIHVVAIGIGGWVDKYEMYAIASYPRDVNVIMVPKIEELAAEKDDLQALVCNKVDECTGEPCKNSGTCIDDLGTYYCRCTNGFVGKTCEGECRERADVTFALDSSGSVGLENFQKEVDFFASVIQGLDINDEMCLVASEQYAGSSEVKFFLDEYSSTKAVLNGFTFYYDAGSTNTGDALRQMREEVFISSRGDRAPISNVGVVLTDGRSNDASDTWQQAVANRENGIDMVAVGIGSNLRENELEGIASSPVDTNVLYVPDFDSIDSVRQTLIDTICNNVDECEPNPCENGGTCQDLRNGYRCGCQPDYTGNTCERECSGEIDLIFVLDVSGSVRSTRFLKVLDFAISIVQELEISETKTQVGAIKFSNNAEIQFNLNQYSARQDIIAALRRVTYMRQRTHTAEALQKLVSDMFTSANGDRENARNVAIVITNANSNINREDTIPRAIDAKNAGIHMVAVGVGNDVDVLELNGLASRPAEANVFWALSQDNLPGLVAGVIDAFCNDEANCDADPCDAGTCLDDFSEYICDCPDDSTGQNCERRCTASMDLVLVLDLSGSVDVVTKMIAKFAESIVYGVNMAFQRAQVGIVIFSDESATWLQLDKYTDKVAVLNTLTFPSAGGKTNTQSALKRLRLDVFTGSAGDRPGVDNRAIVITDGYSNVDQDQTLPEAKSCRDDDIELFVVAIGENPGMNEINGIASDPDSGHVFRVASVDDVESEANRLLDALCQ